MLRGAGRPGENRRRCRSVERRGAVRTCRRLLVEFCCALERAHAHGSGLCRVDSRRPDATTDMQYIVHQGFTPHQATYWVGANALLRKAALEDIATCEQLGSVVVRKFIQDRTVIEDTESSIDLIRRGWTLHNHPQR